MSIERRYPDVNRRAAAVAGAVVTGILLVLLVLHLTGVWQGLNPAWPWLVALIPAVIVLAHFGATMSYRLVIDDRGIARGRGEKLTRVGWDQVSEFVELTTTQRHLAVLSSQLTDDRSPGENSMLRAFRLPGPGLVFQADDEVRRVLTDRLGRPRTVREVVGL